MPKESKPDIDLDRLRKTLLACQPQGASLSDIAKHTKSSLTRRTLQRRLQELHTNGAIFTRGEGPATRYFWDKPDWWKGFSCFPELSATEVLKGLLDHGLFGERLPGCFNSEGMTSALKAESLVGELISEDLKKVRGYVHYELVRDTLAPRPMGLPHPQAYVTLSSTITQFWEEIAKHCGHGENSNSRIFAQRYVDGSVFKMSYGGVNALHDEDLTLSRMGFARYHVAADISNCFPGMYTHSIPWAIHGKSLSKKRRNDLTLAGNCLDMATRATTEGQTVGILIGPHASSIISEIVLTEIDRGLERAGFQNFLRYIDDYNFYARSEDEANSFIAELSRLLREYSLRANGKKQKITPLPAPTRADWTRKMRQIAPPISEETGYGVVRDYLDTALECSQRLEKYAALTWAIKVVAGLNLSGRAAKLYIQRILGIAITCDYIVPLLDEYVLSPFLQKDGESLFREFLSEALLVAKSKDRPGTIIHLLWLSQRFGLQIPVDEGVLVKLVEENDCLCNVMLFHYAQRYGGTGVVESIREICNDLLKAERCDRDQQWLLLYEVAEIAELEGAGEEFLARLKQVGFKFVRLDPERP